MKIFIPILAVALVAAGCSPTGDTPASQEPTVRAPAPPAADLGKTEEYFRGLYGAPTSGKPVENYSFPVPWHSRVITLTRPLFVQEYRLARLSTMVVYSRTQRAICVKYTLPSPWTQEQINAALKAYDSEWGIVPVNVGQTAISVLMPDIAQVMYVSRGGSLACKGFGANSLTVYAPQLCVDLNRQIEEAQRQKETVPKF